MGSKQTTTQKAEPWAVAQPFLKGGLQDASNLYKAGGFQIDPYGGQMVAGRDPLQDQAYANAPGMAQDALASLGGVQSTLAGMTDPNQQSAAFQSVLQNTINRNMAGVNSSFAGSGMTGSGLHQQNLAAGVSSGIADVVNNNWNQGQDRALAASGALANNVQAGLGVNDYLNRYGSEAQGYQQDVINANVLRDQQGQAAQAEALKNYMALISGVSAGYGTQTGMQSSSPGLFGILGAGLQAAPLLFSDIRLKTDIEKVGETDKGLGVYSYRYKAGGPKMLGLMAQEVEQTKPDAVQEVGGFKAVDYGKALA